MPGLSGLIANGSAFLSSPGLWKLSRESIKRRGAIQHIDELTQFACAVRSLQPWRILEVGTAQGGVFWLLCRLAHPDATLISVDLPSDSRFSGGIAKLPELAAMKSSGQTVHAILGDSHSQGVLDQVKALLHGESLDLLFIDGDHTYEGVMSDYEMYGPLVRPGGLIAFHDIVDTPWEACQVNRLWAELAAAPRLAPRRIVGHVKSHFGGIGLLRQPGTTPGSPARVPLEASLR
jgi:predicted O-methyltransferase YrrM